MADTFQRTYKLILYVTDKTRSTGVTMVTKIIVKDRGIMGQFKGKARVGFRRSAGNPGMTTDPYLAAVLDTAISTIYLTNRECQSQ